MPDQDPKKVKFTSDYSTIWQCLKAPFHSPIRELMVWEVSLSWQEVYSMLRYDHLSCGDIIEAARKELGSSYSWQLRKKIVEKVKFRFKIKRLRASFFNPWWNHMIVTEIDSDMDIIYVVCPCTPNEDPEKVKFESDYISLSHLKDYFRLTDGKHQPELTIWEVPLPWHLI